MSKYPANMATLDDWFWRHNRQLLLWELPGWIKLSFARFWIFLAGVNNLENETYDTSQEK